jgi:hypothetical protein
MLDRADHIARERELGDGTSQRTVVERRTVHLERWGAQYHADYSADRRTSLLLL